MTDLLVLLLVKGARIATPEEKRFVHLIALRHVSVLLVASDLCIRIDLWRFDLRSIVAHRGVKMHRRVTEILRHSLLTPTVIKTTVLFMASINIVSTWLQ